MSTYALAVRPDRLVSHRGRGGHGGMHTLLQLLRDVRDILAFSYRLRTAGNGGRQGRSAAR